MFSGEVRKLFAATVPNARLAALNAQLAAPGAQNPPTLCIVRLAEIKTWVRFYRYQLSVGSRTYVAIHCNDIFLYHQIKIISLTVCLFTLSLSIIL